MRGRDAADVGRFEAVDDKRDSTLPEFEDFANMLVSDAVQSLVDDARHKENVRRRKEAGEHGGPVKVVVANSDAVRQVAKTVLDGQKNKQGKDDV